MRFTSCCTETMMPASASASASSSSSPASMSPAVQRYRQLAEVQPELQQWLAQRAGR